LFDCFLDFATTAVIDQNQLLYSLRNTISYWNEFLVFRKPWLYVLNNYHEKHLSFGATSNTHPTLPRTTKGYGVQFSIPCPQTWPDTPSHFSLFGQYRSWLLLCYFFHLGSWCLVLQLRQLFWCQTACCILTFWAPTIVS
jgi:hypothetical protein